MSTTQARVRALNARAGMPAGLNLRTVAVTALAASGAAYVAVDLPEYYHAALAIAIGLNIIVLGMRWPRAAALVTLFFLPFLALVRRLLIADTGWVPNDPLLLVAPVVALFLLYRLYTLEGRRLDRDRLATLILMLIGFAILQAFNPLGAGGIIASLGGLLFLAIPLLWFFIGRRVTDDRIVSLLLQVVVAIAVVVALYGLYQTDYGPGNRLPSWDQNWFEVAGYNALDV